MKPNLKDLEKLDKIRVEEQRRYNLAVSLQLCPICGAKLIEKVIHHKAEYFLGIFPTCRAFNYYKTVCSIDETHYGHYDDDDDDEDDFE